MKHPVSQNLSKKEFHHYRFLFWFRIKQFKKEFYDLPFDTRKEFWEKDRNLCDNISNAAIYLSVIALILQTASLLMNR